jgi:hypothetical protein
MDRIEAMNASFFDNYLICGHLDRETSKSAIPEGKCRKTDGDFIRSVRLVLTKFKKHDDAMYSVQKHTLK